MLVGKWVNLYLEIIRLPAKEKEWLLPSPKSGCYPLLRVVVTLP